MLERTITLPDPFDMAASLATVGVRTSAGVARWATRTQLGPASLRLSVGVGSVTGEAWGPGADDVLERLPRLLGLDDDPAAFPAPSGLMRDLALRSRGVHLGSTAAMFEAILPGVLGQVVTGVEAKRSQRLLIAALGEPAPGPSDGIRLQPAPATIAALGFEDLHRFGIERKRAQILIECARRARRIEQALDMEPPAAWNRLLAVRGIGPWTAAGAMGAAYGDRDAVLVGDYNLPSMVTWALAGRPRGTDDEMLELLEPYRPFRRRALMLLKRSGIKPPKYGPRTALRAHL